VETVIILLGIIIILQFFLAYALYITNVKMEEYRVDQVATSKSSTEHFTTITKLLRDAALALRKIAEHN
jgi:uncharacterized membrane protein